MRTKATTKRLTCLMREYRAPNDCLGNRSRPMVVKKAQERKDVEERWMEEVKGEEDM